MPNGSAYFFRESTARFRPTGLVQGAWSLDGQHIAPAQVAFPNLDLTAHLFRTPQPGPIGFDISVSFGPEGAGLTLTTLHDSVGPFGSSVQTLTVRPR